MDIYKNAEIKLEFYKKLLEKINYCHINESDCQVSYIASVKAGDWFALQSGLMAKYLMQKKNMFEKPAIRKNCQNFFKIYRSNDTIRRIDLVLGGRIDVIFIPYTENNLWIFKPFSSDGGFYPTYSHITEFNNGEVSCEYAINGRQIISYIYEKVKTNEWNYTNLNYVPLGTYPVLYLEKGIFRINDTISYEEKHCKGWYEKFKEDQKAGRIFKEKDII